MSKVIIIGAGIGGIATANLLTRDGHDVHVYERSSGPGGRAGKLEAEGFTYDTGPSWYLMPEVFERYYAAFGKSAEEELSIIKLDPSYKVFYENKKPLLITGNQAHDRATFEVIEPGAGVRLADYATKARRLYDLSLKYFLYTDFSRLRDFMKPGILLRGPQMLGLMTTPIHRYVSRFVRTKQLQQILEYPMVFLGTSPYEAPALYSLMGALDFDSGVFYPKRGIYSVIENLTAIGVAAGVTYNFDSDVATITTDGSRATGITLKDGTAVVADIVISNADLHHTETRLLAPDVQSFPESYWKDRQPSSSALLLYLGIKGELPELEHHNLLFVDAWRENFEALYKTRTTPEKASLYLSRTSATDSNVAPDGHETIFVLVPLPPGDGPDETDIAAMSAHYIAQIETMCNVSLSDRIVYQSAFTPRDFGDTFHSWQNSMLGPSHVLKQSAFWRTPNKSRKLSNLYYVGAGTTPGIGLPMCLISATNLAGRIARDRGSAS